mmetsp:Transcript_7800/g.14706  ORF Transcript_7800/g.14706 Transcript_7800/m.14706 type:complete len:242 (-) Transcript_7800:1203-1928(-)
MKKSQHSVTILDIFVPVDRVRHNVFIHIGIGDRVQADVFQQLEELLGILLLHHIQSTGPFRHFVGMIHSKKSASSSRPLEISLTISQFLAQVWRGRHFGIVQCVGLGTHGVHEIAHLGVSSGHDHLHLRHPPTQGLTSSRAIELLSGPLRPAQWGLGARHAARRAGPRPSTRRWKPKYSFSRGGRHEFLFLPPALSLPGLLLGLSHLLLLESLQVMRLPGVHAGRCLHKLLLCEHLIGRFS